MDEERSKEEEPRIQYRSEKEMVDDLFQASKRKIEILIREDLTPKEISITQPVRQHLPELTNMEEYEDWIKEAEPFSSQEKRFKKDDQAFVGAKIKVKEIFKEVTTTDGRLKKCSHVMALGSAGTGKTTLLRRIAHKGGDGVLDGRVILVPDFRAFSVDEQVLPAEALLGDLFPTWEEKKMEQRYQWMIDHSERIAFVVDSIDTLPFDLESERERTGYHARASTDVIVHNLLSRDLFPGSLIISSSREYKVRNLHPSVRPDRCIILDGLKKDSVEDLIDGFLGESAGAEVKEHINNECPEVWSLLSVPVFLTFGIICFKQGGFRPKTMSGILTKLFVSMIGSPYTHVKDIFAVLYKLMALSFGGIRNGRVLFTRNDLMAHGLTPEEAKDLGVIIPQSTGPYLTSKLIQDHRFYLYFKHQTEQECLAAFHILSMDLREFRDFIKKDLYEASFNVVRRLVCGILLDNEVLEEAKKLIKITDYEEKKSSLIDSLDCALNRVESKEDLLELFIDLNEGKDGARELIRSSLSEINFSQTPLSPSAVQAVASVMKNCDYLSLVNLWNANLDEGKLEILTKTLMKSNLKIDELKVGGTDFGDNGMVRLAKLVKHCLVKSFGILSSSLQWQRMKAFHDGESMKLEKLDVSGNHDLGLEGIHYLGKVVKHYGVKDVCATWCNVKSQHVERFTKGLEDAKIDYLDLEDMWGMPVYGRSIVELLPHVRKELTLTGWKVNERQKLEIRERLDEIASPLLTVILGQKRSPVQLRATLKEIPIDNATFAEMDRRIKTPSIKCETIRPTGGFIENCGCRFTFQRRAFDIDTEVRTIVSTDFSDCLADRVRIAPVVGCTHAGELKEPALLEIEHWLFPSEESACIEVYKKDEESSEWRFFTEKFVGRNERITLTVGNFSFYEFVVKCWNRASEAWSQITRPRAKLQNLVYISGIHRSLTCICCVEGNKVIADVTKSLTENGYVSLLPLAVNANVSRDCEIDVTIKSSEPRDLYLIVKEQLPAQIVKISFPVKDVLSISYSSQQIALRGLQGVDFDATTGVVAFRYVIVADGTEVSSQPLQIDWPIPHPVPRIVVENNVNFNAPVCADKISIYS